MTGSRVWVQSLRQRHQHLHIAEWEEARLAVQHPLIPVLVNLVGKRDEVTLAEAQLAIILWLKVIKRLAAWLVQGCWEQGRSVSALQIDQWPGWVEVGPALTLEVRVTLNNQQKGGSGACSPSHPRMAVTTPIPDTHAYSCWAS